MNNNKLLSEMAKTIIPYQWSTNVGLDMLRFDTNTLTSPPPSAQKLLTLLKQNCPINEYGDPSYTKLRTLIADYEGIDETMITITNSGDEALDVVGKTFLNAGDYFLVQPPTYEMFTIQCNINKGKVVEVPLQPDTFNIDTQRVIRVLKDKPIKITFICTPNNPTGSVTPLAVVEKITQSSSGIIVIDETYREFWGITNISLLKKYPNLIILRSFSKFGAIAGARVGYLIASKELSQIFDVIRFPLGVSYFSYKLAELLLEYDRKWIKKQSKEIIRERDRVIKELNKFGLFIYPSQANFLLVKIGKKAQEICQKLKKRNILVRDRSSKPYLKGCIRITIRNPQQNNILLKNLQEIL